MKSQCLLVKSIFLVFVFSVMVNFSTSALKAETALEQLKKKQEVENKQEAGPDLFPDSLGNFISIGTGEIRDGQQIPLPKYQDGTLAKRSESHYIVSPKEMSTAFTHLGGGGAYFIRCAVDQEGVVHASLWQYDGAGQEINVIEDKSYEELKKYYESIGTQYEGSGDFRAQLMKTIREKVVLNYMVIAIRSFKKGQV